MNRIATTLTLTLVAAVFLAGPASAAAPIKIETLSSKPNWVTGGDALLAVTAPSGTSRNKLIIRRNGTVVTSAFNPDPNNSQRLIGLLTGLKDGPNVVTAWAGTSAVNPARHNLFNSPRVGPLFSGPHQTPYYCTTAELGAGAPTDANCSGQMSVAYFYRNTGGDFLPLVDPSTRPADLAQTTTRTGQTVDYVVRVETGTINRAVYKWAVLASGGVTGNGWNKRFFYNYGGGCSTGHQQGQAVPGPLNNPELSRGYAVMSSSLNVFNTSCNDVLSAETTSMVKERAIESLGEKPVWTAGQGGSGGSVQIQMMVQNYPGLLDGINPGASFPDNSRRRTIPTVACSTVSSRAPPAPRSATASERQSPGWTTRTAARPWPTGPTWSTPQRAASNRWCRSRSSSTRSAIPVASGAPSGTTW